MEIPVFTDNLTILGDGTEVHPLHAGGGIGPSFADSETPAGATPGTAFTLAHAPNPAASLILVWNGVTLKRGGVDYTLVGNAVTTVQIIGAGDSFICWYRY
jgi:hypothetical protein